ncbi:hypothetical protein VT930_09610 [Mycobacterium sherrisii]|uniref:hypothetical protein n=1 Tax=Mycobacterium sherrisii TaxID=243061 RepID=UPI002DDCE563|nr:hypothetical protein [Mycobacterium sherrisii]MEC4763360.1 hypothetical protein [Mycobacterium sherrisii]
MPDNNSEKVTVTDMRRAAALLTHYAAGDTAGLAEIWREAAEADEFPDLLSATVALFFRLNPELATPEGHQRLQELTRAYRAAEAAGDGEQR